MNSQRILSAVAPDCMNYISTEQLENALWTETGALLREQFIIFKEIIAVLTTMEDEEYSNENTHELYHDLRTLRSDSQQLLCEIYIAIDLSGSPVPDRELSASIPLCIATGRLDRYERDYFLINRIKSISKLLQNQYIEL
ncbi:uncharacterized protein LOC134714000 [Mytilus trossulus]|uniref:uncharacterized protein LOC134714000 n=1 Tax=Mytilus trossulus TaxID=6551 RepID=UPI0030058AD9